MRVLRSPAQWVCVRGAPAALRDRREDSEGLGSVAAGRGHDGVQVGTLQWVAGCGEGSRRELHVWLQQLRHRVALLQAVVQLAERAGQGRMPAGRKLPATGELS